MSEPTLAQILDWWMGELPPEEADRVEEAWFAHDGAFARASWLAGLAAGVAQAAGQGGIVAASLTHHLATRLEGAGIPHRRYVVDPGGAVDCAADAEQRFAIVHLRGDFAGTERVDVRVTSPHMGELQVEDVPVNWADGEVTLLQGGDVVRSLPTTTLTFEVRGRRGGERVLIGTYVLRHHAMG